MRAQPFSKSLTILTLLLVISASLLISCSGDDGDVYIMADAPLFTIKNESPSPVFYFVMDTGFLAMVQMAPPCDPFRPNLKAGKTDVIPFTDIPGYNENSKTAVAFWTDCNGNKGSTTFNIK